MWVKEWNKRKNKEKCVNGAIVPDREGEQRTLFQVLPEG